MSMTAVHPIQERRSEAALIDQVACRRAGVFDLHARMRIEYSAVGGQRPCIVPLVIAIDPCLQMTEHRVLCFARSVLVRLPRTAAIVLEAGLAPGIEEDQFVAGRRRGESACADPGPGPGDANATTGH